MEHAYNTAYRNPVKPISNNESSKKRVMEVTLNGLESYEWMDMNDPNVKSKVNYYKRLFYERTDKKNNMNSIPFNAAFFRFLAEKTMLKAILHTFIPNIRWQGSCGRLCVFKERCDIIIRNRLDLLPDRPVAN
jgi:hypothetical protein